MLVVRKLGKLEVLEERVRNMKQIPAAIYRGGTSRAIFFHEKDLPADIKQQDKVILQAVGSGHSLQVNGVGGGNPQTSKCAIIGPPSRLASARTPARSSSVSLRLSGSARKHQPQHHSYAQTDVSVSCCVFRSHARLGDGCSGCCDGCQSGRKDDHL